MRTVRYEVRLFIYDVSKTFVCNDEIAERLGIPLPVVERIIFEESKRGFDDKSRPRAPYRGPWPTPDEIWEDDADVVLD